MSGLEFTETSGGNAKISTILYTTNPNSGCKENLQQPKDCNRIHNFMADD